MVWGLNREVCEQFFPPFKFSIIRVHSLACELPSSGCSSLLHLTCTIVIFMDGMCSLKKEDRHLGGGRRRAIVGRSYLNLYGLDKCNYT